MSAALLGPLADVLCRQRGEQDDRILHINACFWEVEGTFLGERKTAAAQG
jgi:hypothetical protein